MVDQVIYFRNPKTASTSIADGLQKVTQFSSMRLLVRGHQTTLGAKSFLRNSELLGWFTVASVRNPYDRLLSAYNYICTYKTDKPELEYVYGVSFDKFIMSIDSHVRRNKFFQPQYLWYMINDERMVDFIIHYENLQNDWSEFLCQLQWSYIDLPTERATTHQNWKDVYTQDMRHVVYQTYQEDFFHLGYDF